MSGPAYLTCEEVVERYRNKVSDGTLRNWRCKRIGPSYIKDRQGDLISYRRARSMGSVKLDRVQAHIVRVCRQRSI